MSDVTLVAALARAQAKFTTVAKSHTAEVPTKTGGKYSYTYANLADTLEAVLPILAAEGIALLQPILMTEFGPVLSTQVRKGSEIIESVFPLRVDGLQPQAVGSLITYSRRYCLTSLLAIATDDDDGQAAQDAPVRYATEPAYKGRERSYTSERGGDTHAPVADGGKPASEAQVRFLEDLATQQGWSDAERDLVFKKLAGIISDPITKATASALIPELKRIAKRELVVEWDNDGKPRIVTAAEAAIADGEEPF